MAAGVSNITAELVVATNMKTAVTGVLVASLMKLTKALVPITRNTTKAELDAAEADYSGYAAEACVWSPNSVDDLGRVELIGTVGEFRPTSSVLTNLCYNGWIESTAGELIMAWVITPGPVSMGAVTDAYQATPRLRPGLAGDVVEVS